MFWMLAAYVNTKFHEIAFYKRLTLFVILITEDVI